MRRSVAERRYGPDNPNAVAGRVPFSYRWLLPGYADRLAYDLGLIDTDVAYDSLRVRFRITDAARAVGDGAGFSARIRAGLMR